MRTPRAEVALSRAARIAQGIVALRDATRMLRGDGAARRSGASETDRGALFELGGLADRLTGYGEDQRGDDWSDFWLTERDVAQLRAHTDSLATSERGLAAATVPALRVLADSLAVIAQPVP